MASVREIAEAWIFKWQGEKPLALQESFETPEFDLEYGSTRSQPELCLDVILDVLTLIDPEKDGNIFSVLAAGPLEDLLAEYGKEVLDKVEKEARSNPAFRLLLNGVWFSNINPVVVSRLEKFITQRW